MKQAIRILLPPMIVLSLFLGAMAALLVQGQTENYGLASTSFAVIAGLPIWGILTIRQRIYKRQAKA